MKRARRFGQSETPSGLYLPPKLREKMSAASLFAIRARARAAAGQGPAPKSAYDRKWRRFSRWFLSQPEHQWCCDCLPRLVPAVEVHHKVKIADDPTLRLDPDNCMGLCKPCHARRTARGE